MTTEQKKEKIVDELSITRGVQIKLSKLSPQAAERVLNYNKDWNNQRLYGKNLHNQAPQPEQGFTQHRPF